MIYIYQYGAGFMFLVVMVYLIIFNVVSRNFQFPFSFQDITLVC